MSAKPSLIRLLLLFFCLSGMVSAKTPTSILGGKSAGPFELGASFSIVSKRLGKPSGVFKSSGDPGTTMRLYKKYQLGFLVNPDNQVIGITVARPDWKTPQGLGVGSPLLAFQEVLGKGLKRGRGDLAFPQDGIALSHSGGKVKAVYVVKIDAKDDTRGDHLLIGGSRAGQLRLGRSSADMKKLLGPPPKRQGPNNNIWSYPGQGIRLAFYQGRLQLVGVGTGDWVTPNGLKVGRPFSEMKKELGRDYRVEKSSVFYDKWGIGARLQGQTIVELLIFTPRKSSGRG